MPKKPCCEQPENLTVRSDTARPGVVVRVCLVCGARHITMAADPGQIGLRGASLGAPSSSS